jgi:TRAP-type C4-dicarboxylate transport system permease small subunit
MRPILRVIDFLVDLLSGRLQAVVVCILTAMILVEVISRYVTQNPLSIAEEYGGYLLVAITYMGLAFTWKKQTHVRVTFLVDKLPLKIKLALRIFTLIVALFFSGFMVAASYQLVQESFAFGDRSGSWLRTPLAWPQMVLIIGSILIFIQLCSEIIQAYRIFKNKQMGI